MSALFPIKYFDTAKVFHNWFSRWQLLVSKDASHVSVHIKTNQYNSETKQRSLELDKPSSASHANKSDIKYDIQLKVFLVWANSSYSMFPAILLRLIVLNQGLNGDNSRHMRPMHTAVMPRSRTVISGFYTMRFVFDLKHGLTGTIVTKSSQ